MKKLLFVLILMSGCASEKTILVKHCKNLGNDLFSCVQLREKDLKP